MVIMNRRDLLKAGGAVIVSFAWERSALGRSAEAFALQTSTPKPLDLSEVDSFLAFHADGTVTVYTSKVDVGTGLRIAVAQMAGEELGIAAQKITIVDGDTALCPDQGGTGGCFCNATGATE